MQLCTLVRLASKQLYLKFVNRNIHCKFLNLESIHEKDSRLVYVIQESKEFLNLFVCSK
jgi:hypothetical protein